MTHLSRSLVPPSPQHPTARRPFAQARRAWALAILCATGVTACGNGGGGVTGSTTPPSAPGAPTAVVSTAGVGSVSLAFAAPASTGGSAITGYTARCSAVAVSVSATGPASPIVVGGLTAGTNYSCTITATNAVGTGATSTTVTVTPLNAPVGSTAAAACGLQYSAMNTSAKVNAMSTFRWTCSTTVRTLAGTGIPDHSVVGGSFATPVSLQTITATFPLTPQATASATNVMVVGYALNSVKFDPATAGSCASNATSIANGAGCVLAMGSDPWRIEALGGAFVFGVDENNAHVQPNGAYHYHGMPVGIVTAANKGQAMTLVGFATDGFPMYARYGYTTATSATSPIKVMTGSYQKKATPDAGRPSVTAFPMGTFTQDYVYVAGSGDLDECNGRTGVTPEFPAGIYHYYVTDSYPYVQRCVKGTVAAGALR